MGMVGDPRQTSARQLTQIASSAAAEAPALGIWTWSVCRSGHCLDRGDGSPDAGVPRSTVAWQHPRGIGCEDGLQGCDRLLGVIGERGRLRAPPAGQDVSGGETVADEDCVGGGNEHGDTAFGVAGRPMIWGAPGRSKVSPSCISMTSVSHLVRSPFFRSV